MTPDQVRRTACGHAFHHTCLGQLLQMDAGRRKCPLCRVPLARSGGAGAAAGAGWAREGYDAPGVVSPQYSEDPYSGLRH